MATFKATVQEHHKKQDGSYNVKIRVTHLRKTRYLATSCYVFKEDMTRTLNIKDQETINLLDAQVKLYYNDIKELGGAISYLSVDDIVKHIEQCEKKRAEDNNPKIDFYAYTDQLIATMIEDNRSGTAGIYKSMKNSLIKFIGDVLYFSDITPSFLKNYQAHLEKPSSKTGARGLSLYMGAIKAVFNQAMIEYNKEELDIIKIKYSPFGRGKYVIPKEPTPEKRAITLIKILELKNIDAAGDSLVELAQDLFMLSFYLCGMNSADLFYCNKFEEGRIIYERRKTRTRRIDKAKISVRVPIEAKTLFNKYKDSSGNRLFNFYNTYSSSDTFNAAINKGLKIIGGAIGIDKLQYYAARHTFATTARNRCKLSRDHIAAALNHSMPEFRLTDTYLDEDWSIIDDVQDKVINELNNCEKLQMDKQ